MMSENEIEKRKQILLLDLEKHIETQDNTQKEILRMLKRIEEAIGIIGLILMIALGVLIFMVSKLL